MKVMLAATGKDNDDVWHGTVQPKYDGVRAYTHPDGDLMSRTNKPIPNEQLQMYASHLPPYVDMELLHTSNDFAQTQSVVMSRDKPADDIRLIVFDYFHPDCAHLPHETRLAYFLEHCVDEGMHYYTEVVCAPSAQDGATETIIRLAAARSLPYGIMEMSVPAPVNNMGGLIDSQMHFISQGYEGLMFRDRDAPYKHGRATLKRKELVKFKLFKDLEAEVVGVEHLVSDTKSPDQLGALVLRIEQNTFKCGTGFSDEQRKTLWEQRESLVGKCVTIKYQELTNAGVPRFPVFKAIREEEA